MRIDPAGWPFVGGGAAVALVAGLAWAPWAALPGVVLTVAMLFFFRDPERRTPHGPADAVFATADGRIMVAGPSLAPAWPADRWMQVSTFLSPLDVHVNRMPVAGRVTRVEYHPGRFLPAYRVESGEANERTEVRLDTPAGEVVVRQVVGLLARRIVCRTRVGATVTAGERFGVMKFGSRMDVFLPREAALRVTTGDRVVAGESIIATLPSGADGPEARS
jgi:phosphatidylserine decarboxylase